MPWASLPEGDFRIKTLRRQPSPSSSPIPTGPTSFGAPSNSSRLFVLKSVLQRGRLDETVKNYAEEQKGGGGHSQLSR